MILDVYPSQGLFQILRILFRVIYPFSFSVIFFPLTSFIPKFCFFCIRLLIYPYSLSTNLLIEFSFVILEVSILFVILILSLDFLNLSSFANIFWIISSSRVIIFVCCNLFYEFSFSRVPVCFDFSFICCLRFCLDSLGGYLFLHWLILILHKITRSVRCLLGYVSICFIYLFSFHRDFFSFDSLWMIMWSSFHSWFFFLFILHFSVFLY